MPGAGADGLRQAGLSPEPAWVPRRVWDPALGSVCVKKGQEVKSDELKPFIKHVAQGL